MQAVRYYGAGGDVSVGNTTGPSIWRYCASLGHMRDDESGLIYMRARYYEPISGRFISEDPELQSGNWYSYCLNDPINKVDESGKSESDVFRGYCMLLALGCVLALVTMFGAGSAGKVASLVAGTLVAAMSGFALGAAGFSDRLQIKQIFLAIVLTPTLMGCALGIAAGLTNARTAPNMASIAIIAVALYATCVLGLLADLHADEDMNGAMQDDSK